MDILIVSELIINILHFALLIAAIVITAKKSREKRGLFEAFYIFGILALALEDIYWIAYDYIRPDARMPFAANEIACSAFLLLFGAAMATKVDKSAPRKMSELIFSILYIVANAVLWIAWSGQWMENIVFAVPYIYYLYYLVRGLRTTEAISSLEEKLFIVINVLIFVPYDITLFTDESKNQLIYNIEYVVIFGLAAYMFIKIFRLRTQENIKDKAVFLSFALFFIYPF